MTPSAWKIAPALTGLTLCLAACSADLGGLEPEPGAPPEDLSTFSSTRFPPGTEVQVCKFKSGLPLRRDPSPYGAIIRYMPEGTRGTVMERLYSWHRLDVAGTIGWAYGTALCLVKQSPPHPKPQGTFLRFAAPADGSSVDNGFWLRVDASANIRRVEYWADGMFKFAESSNGQGGFARQVTMYKVGRRTISARAYDEQGRWLTKSSITITVKTPGPGPGHNPSDLINKMPYFYQYNNALHPSASCQNTSLAMVLKYYGWSGTPDTITKYFGKNKAQSPAGLAQVFNHYAAKMGTSRRLRAHTDGRVSDVRALLKVGKPVIVHGYFTGYGHVLVLTGYDGTHYTANDPAGRWSQVFKGGYGGGYGQTAGRRVRYQAAALEKAIVSTNGHNSVPIWYHEVR